jgi:hypothetical protein
VTPLCEAATGLRGFPVSDASGTCGGTVDGERSAVLLLRVWSEEGVPTTLRGRLTTRDTSPGGPGAPETTVAVAASREDVLDAVRAWLAVFLRDLPPAADAGE